MPKYNHKGSEGKKDAAVVAQTDDDFDDMLAELREADLTTFAASSSNSSSSSSGSGSGSGSNTASFAPASGAPRSSTTSNAAGSLPSAAAEDDVSEHAIVQACIRGDITQLRWWARRGVRVSSGNLLTQAALRGNLELMRCLVNDLGAAVNRADRGSEGFTPFCAAAQKGHLAAVQCLVTELSANVNQAMQDGGTPLYVAAEFGHLAVVRYLVEELGADVNQARKDGATPLMGAACREHHKVVVYLIKHGADPKISTPDHGTAADVSKSAGAPAAQTAYLEAKMHCSNPACDGAGIKKCTGCKEARYCGEQCQLAHWPAHKIECKEATRLKAAK